MRWFAARAPASRAHGGCTPELHLNPDVWGVGSRREVVETAARRFGLNTEELDRSAYVLAGSVQQVIEYLVELRETLGISYVTIASDQMDEFADVVQRLAGR